MTINDAQALTRMLFAAWPRVNPSPDTVRLYSEALRQFSRGAATVVIQSLTEEASSQFGPRENPPPLPVLLAQLRSRAHEEDSAPTFTGRDHLAVPDTCIECTQRITDKEFERHEWDFVPPDGPVFGRIHERCKARRYGHYLDSPETLERRIANLAAEYARLRPFYLQTAKMESQALTRMEWNHYIDVERELRELQSLTIPGGHLTHDEVARRIEEMQAHFSLARS
jgi:hypothetical protein